MIFSKYIKGSLFLCVFSLSSCFLFSQSISFSSTQSTSCFNPTACPILFFISGDAGGAVSNTIKLTYTSTTNPSKVFVVSLSGNSQYITMNINPSNIQSSVSVGGAVTVNYVSPGTATTLPNDIYTIRASYQRVSNGATISSTTPVTERFWVTTPPPVINSPAKSIMTKNLLSVNATIPGFVRDSLPTIKAETKKIVIADTFNNVYTLTLTNTTETNFILDLHHLYALNTNVGSTSISSFYATDSLHDGYYKMYFSYQDGMSHSVATDSTTFTLKTFTAAPTISYPTPTTIFNSATSFQINYFLPDLGSTAAISLLSASNSYTFPISSQSNTNMQWIPSTTIPDGKYSVKLSYYDIALNPPGTTSVDSILIKTKSATPSILSPADGAVVSRIFYRDTVSEIASVPDTLTISGYSTFGIYQNRKFAFNVNSLTNSMNYDLQNDPSDGTNIISLSGAGALPDGNYTLLRSHKDIYGNPTVYSTPVNVTVKTNTTTPLLVSPTSYSTNSNVVTISYVLPDRILPNSAKLVFFNSTGTYLLTLNSQNTTSVQSFTWDINTNPIGAAVNSVSSNLTNGLPSGIYTVSLQYQDFVGNPVSTDIKYAVKILSNASSIYLVKPVNKSYVDRYLTYKDSLDNPIDIDGLKTISIIKDGKSVAVISNNAVTTNNRIDSFLIDVLHLKWNNISNTVIGTDSLTDGKYIIKASYQSRPTTNGIYPALSEFSDTITVQSNPFVGSIAHYNKVVYASYVDTLSFNYPVQSYNFDSLSFNKINGLNSAKIDSVVTIDNRKFAIYITPLQFGKIKLQYSYAGAAIDSAGVPSIAILSDSGLYYAARIIPTISGNLSFCQGDSTILSASAAKSYLWSNGATTQTIVVKQSAVYNITATYDNEVTGVSNNIIVTSIVLPPAPNVRDTSFCLNAINASLSITPSLGNTLQWYGSNMIGGTSTTMASVPNTSIVGTQAFYVSQKSITNACESPRARIITTINAIPTAPILSRDTANRLVANTNGIIWYKDGISIADTTQKFKPITGGTFTAKANQNGCISVLSNPYYYLVTDIINLSADEFIKLAPNPFINKLNFDFSIKGYQKLNLEVFEISTGARVAVQQNLTPGSFIYLGQLSSGTYVVKVTSNDLKIAYQFKIVKL
jgi:hypothetical protein